MADDYTPLTDEMLDGYVTMRGREIPGDRVLASVQALGEAERWLAGVIAEKRAEWEAEQGTEEPEWEYRSHVVNDLKRHVLSDWTNEETALAIIGWESGRPREAAWVERRRKAGPVMPVEQEGNQS